MKIKFKTNSQSTNPSAPSIPELNKKTNTWRIVGIIFITSIVFFSLWAWFGFHLKKQGILTIDQEKSMDTQITEKNKTNTNTQNNLFENSFIKFEYPEDTSMVIKNNDYTDEIIYILKKDDKYDNVNLVDISISQIAYDIQSNTNPMIFLPRYIKLLEREAEDINKLNRFNVKSNIENFGYKTNTIFEKDDVKFEATFFVVFYKFKSPIGKDSEGLILDGVAVSGYVANNEVEGSFLNTILNTISEV